MNRDLRDLARSRWREAHEHEARMATRRRLITAFMFGLGATLATAMAAETAVQWYVRASVEKIKQGLRDPNGVVAVEAAIILPVFLLAVGFAFDLWEVESLNSGASFTAQSAAATGGRLLNQKAGAIDNATNAATASYRANAGTIFFSTATPTLGSIFAYDAGGNMTGDDAAAVSLGVSVSVTAPCWFPLMCTTLQSSATGRS